MPDHFSLRSLLVLGGARSGKSRIAQQLAERSGRHPILIATAEALDAEMAARIARHRQERDARWGLVEEPVQLAVSLGKEARSDRILVIDCVTLWLNNLLAQGQDPGKATRDLTQALPQLTGPVIFVSNEVGQGIVPDNALAREFRDAQGRLNQALAEACDGVILVAAGLMLQIKPAPRPNICF